MAFLTWTPQNRWENVLPIKRNANLSENCKSAIHYTLLIIKLSNFFGKNEQVYQVKNVSF